MIEVRGSANSDQLKMMTAALHAYCQEHGIEHGGDEAEHVARRIVALFAEGAQTHDKVLAGLRRADERSQHSLRMIG